MSGTEWFCGVQLGGVKLPAEFPAARNSKSMVHAGTGRWRQKNGRPMLIVGSRPAVYRMAVRVRLCVYFRVSRPTSCRRKVGLCTRVNGVARIIVWREPGRRHPAALHQSCTRLKLSRIAGVCERSSSQQSHGWSHRVK